MKWEPEWRSALADVWPSGLSSAKIGVEFTRRFGREFTKNAIVGQVHKCGLTPRPQPGGRKSNNLVIPATATHSAHARQFATTAESEALIKRLHAAGHSKAAIEGMQPHKRTVIDRILGMQAPIARHIPPRAPRVVCSAPPKPPEAPKPAPTQQRRGATCQWVIGKGRMCDQPATTFRPDGRPAPEGAVWCVCHRAQTYVRRTAPAEAYA